MVSEQERVRAICEKRNLYKNKSGTFFQFLPNELMDKILMNEIVKNINKGDLKLRPKCPETGEYVEYLDTNENIIYPHRFEEGDWRKRSQSYYSNWSTWITGYEFILLYNFNDILLGTDPSADTCADYLGGLADNDLLELLEEYANEPNALFTDLDSMKEYYSVNGVLQFPKIFLMIQNGNGSFHIHTSNTDNIKVRYNTSNKTEMYLHFFKNRKGRMTISARDIDYKSRASDSIRETFHQKKRVKKKFQKYIENLGKIRLKKLCIEQIKDIEVEPRCRALVPNIPWNHKAINRELEGFFIGDNCKNEEVIQLFKSLTNPHTRSRFSNSRESENYWFGCQMVQPPKYHYRKGHGNSYDMRDKEQKYKNPIDYQILKRYIRLYEESKEKQDKIHYQILIGRVDSKMYQDKIYESGQRIYNMCFNQLKIKGKQRDPNTQSWIKDWVQYQQVVTEEQGY